MENQGQVFSLYTGLIFKYDKLLKIYKKTWVFQNLLQE